MKITEDLYKSSLTLLTDLYQLTMAYGYWKSGMAEKEAVFNLFFRENPFKGGFAINCGLGYAIDFLNDFYFRQEDIDYLSTLKGNDGNPLFEQAFLDYLRDMEFSCDIDAIHEGQTVFPHEPLIRVKGPILQCQLLETPLLNAINFQTLIATKAARINIAARGEPVLEFGLRRAHGIDGALAASRASYIGGCSSTSNVLAGKLFGIPVSGTHAHSWVMAFENELAAFKAYAKAMPNNCILLVDTYDTLEGLTNAIEVGKILREQGKTLAGVRIDSGDLAYFSTKAREMLDKEGFTDTNIVASNDLDENIIGSLKTQDAKINVWGIGTKLVTAFDQPTLGAVYKLSAIKKDDGEWDYKIKLSEQAIKVNNPGIQQVRRFIGLNGNTNQHQLMADMLYDERKGLSPKLKIVDPMDPTRRKLISSENLEVQDLLVPVFKKGKLVYELPSIEEIKNKVQSNLKLLPGGVKRFVNPHSYPVGLEEQLYNLKTDLIFKLRNLNEE